MAIVGLRLHKLLAVDSAHHTTALRRVRRPFISL
jgi:hypothetical protein